MLLAAAVVLAGASGFGVRKFVNAHSPKGAIDDHPNLPVVSDQERRLLAAIELYAAPKSPDKVRQGAGHHVELGVLYWEDKRYADAERLFEEMVKKPTVAPTYKAVSSLGLAVTFALRDEVDRSNRLFLELRKQVGVGKPLIPQGALPPEDGINLRHWIATALDRNATRPPAIKEIDDMRKELRRRPNLNNPGKPG